VDVAVRDVIAANQWLVGCSLSNEMASYYKLFRLNDLVPLRLFDQALLDLWPSRKSDFSFNYCKAQLLSSFPRRKE